MCLVMELGTRGHSSHIQVGIAIDLDSCLVLDSQVLSNYMYCNGCLRGPKSDLDGYAEWLVNHQINSQKNFDGSAGQPMPRREKMPSIFLSLLRENVEHNVVRWRQQSTHSGKPGCTYEVVKTTSTM